VFLPLEFVNETLVVIFKGTLHFVIYTCFSLLSKNKTGGLGYKEKKCGYTGYVGNMIIA
jgi:hypothetical protein